jgi:hypothetical protein
VISFFVSQKIKINQTNLYKYLQVYSLNSALMSFILCFLFLSYSPRYFNVFREPIGIWYRCRMMAYGFFSSYFFNCLLDIIIVLQRLLIFSPKLNCLKKINPFFLSLLLCLFSGLIYSIVPFLFDSISDFVLISTKSNNYCVLSSFGRSKIGSV